MFPRKKEGQSGTFETFYDPLRGEDVAPGIAVGLAASLGTLLFLKGDYIDDPPGAGGGGAQLTQQTAGAGAVGREYLSTLSVYAGAGGGGGGDVGGGTAGGNGANYGGGGGSRRAATGGQGLIVLTYTASGGATRPVKMAGVWGGYAGESGGFAG